MKYLAVQLINEDCDACHVALRAREAGSQTRPHGVASHSHDRNAARRSRCRNCGGGSPRHEDVDLEIDQLCEECSMLLRLTRDAELDDDVLVLDVAQIPKPLAESLKPPGKACSRLEEPNPWHLPRLLPLGGERRGQDAARRQPEERPTLHHRCPLPTGRRADRPRARSRTAPPGRVSS